MTDPTRPLAAAAEQAAAGLAAAWHRGAQAERAAIALVLQGRAEALRGRKALGAAEEVEALAFYVERRGGGQ